MMTDSEHVGIPENPRGPGDPPTDKATTPPQAAKDPGEFNEPEKFKEKSRTDVLRSYVELEKLHSQINEEKKQYEAFVTQIAPYFVRDDDGRIDWNNDMLTRLAEARGLLKGEPPPAKPTPEQQQQQTDRFKDSFEDNPEETLEKKIRDVMKEVMSETVLPLQTRLNQQEHNQWMREVEAKYPDLNKYWTKMSQLMSQNGFKVNSAQDLEKAYLATKAITGGMLDKETAEKEIAQREAALSVLQGVSNTHPPILDEMNAPEGDLIGLSKSKNKKQDITYALFDKSTLDPLP